MMLTGSWFNIQLLPKHKSKRQSLRQYYTERCCYLSLNSKQDMNKENSTYLVCYSSFKSHIDCLVYQCWEFSTQFLALGKHTQAFGGASPGSSLLSAAWDSRRFKAPGFCVHVSRLLCPVRWIPWFSWHQLSWCFLLSWTHALFFIFWGSWDRQSRQALLISSHIIYNYFGNKRQVGDKKGPQKGGIGLASSTFRSHGIL